MADPQPGSQALNTLAKELAQIVTRAVLGNPVPESEIPDKFKWDDTTEYRWRIKGPTFASFWSRAWFLVTAVVGSLLTGFVIAIVPLWLVGLRWRNAAFWIAVVLFAFFFVNLLKDHLLLVIGSKRIKLLMQVHLMFFAVFPMMLLGYLMMSPVPIARDAFTGTTTGGISWLLFFLDHVKNVILFGFPDALGWKLSGIESVTWYANAASQVLDMLIALGLIDLVLFLRTLAFADIEFYGNVKDASFQCHPLKNFQGTLRREAVVIKRVPEVCHVQSFRRVYPFSPAHGWN
jgi:hypothetical protein